MGHWGASTHLFEHLILLYLHLVQPFGQCKGSLSWQTAICGIFMSNLCWARKSGSYVGCITPMWGQKRNGKGTRVEVVKGGIGRCFVPIILISSFSTGDILLFMFFYKKMFICYCKIGCCWWCCRCCCCLVYLICFRISNHKINFNYKKHHDRNMMLLLYKQHYNLINCYR